MLASPGIDGLLAGLRMNFIPFFMIQMAETAHCPFERALSVTVRPPATSRRMHLFICWFVAFPILADISGRREICDH